MAITFVNFIMFQHTAARRRLGQKGGYFSCLGAVSTHSRPKAAGILHLPPVQSIQFQHTAARRRLAVVTCWCCRILRFQHTAARRRLGRLLGCVSSTKRFQHTAARRRLEMLIKMALFNAMFQHTAARRRLASAIKPLSAAKTFQHTAARRRLAKAQIPSRPRRQFQHTAARRRLEITLDDNLWLHRFNTQPPEGGWIIFFPVNFLSTVSTHSRPKAAGSSAARPVSMTPCFNTQPPEGGWRYSGRAMQYHDLFQHTAARRRLENA